MSVEVALLVSIVSAAFSVFFGLKNTRRSDTKEITERAQANAVINVKLDTISKSMEELKAQMASLVTKVDAHSDRLTKVEASTERLGESIIRVHNRIDSVEDRLNQSERQNKEGRKDE